MRSACLAVRYNPHSHIQALKPRVKPALIMPRTSVVIRAQQRGSGTVTTRNHRNWGNTPQLPAPFHFNCAGVLQLIRFDVLTPFSFYKVSSDHYHRPPIKQDTLKAFFKELHCLLPHAVIQAPTLTNQASIFSFGFFCLRSLQKIHRQGSCGGAEVEG